MSEVKWTKEQRQVIESRNTNLLVSAAAGSGKTAVLIERIIELVLDEKNPIDINKLLVVTFTKLAASEMRERVSKAIEKNLKKIRKMNIFKNNYCSLAVLTSQLLTLFVKMF
ncbi:putative ATP-dependent helicase/nuclease subunit A [Parvimonas sp. oral taxon 110 str. F0139]|nr:putative ATP-dependent helicase/nuclease subunit A [Parvimonas sp. oral taxon 110 str. F0139]